MARSAGQLGGRLQNEVMQVLWRLGEGTVDDVRAAQPSSRRVAYTTMQTVLNRLLERGLLQRRKVGKAFVYRPRWSEPELLARTLRDRLAGASADARTPALLNLIEGLDPDELEEVARYASRVRRERGQR